MKTYAIVSVVLISLVMVYMFVFRKKENYSSNVGTMYMTLLSQMSKSNVSANTHSQINILMNDSKRAIAAIENVNKAHDNLTMMIYHESPMVQNTFSEFSTKYFPNGSMTP